MQRKEELEKKRAKLAELRKAREDRKVTLDTQKRDNVRISLFCILNFILTISCLTDSILRTHVFPSRSLPRTFQHHCRISPRISTLPSQLKDRISTPLLLLLLVTFDR